MYQNSTWMHSNAHHVVLQEIEPASDLPDQKSTMTDVTGGVQIQGKHVNTALRGAKAA